MKKFFLGLDQGTTGTTAILFDENWRLAARGYREIRQIYPQAGWVEHDATDIWDSVLYAVREAMREAGAEPQDIACIGIDHEGESVMMWDKLTGTPVYNTIVWQDRRTARYADAVAEKHGDLIRERTGLMVDSYFSALKLRWLLDNVPEAKSLLERDRLLAGTMDSWLVWKMTHGKLHITDASTASRTMLLNLREGNWDDDVLKVLDLDRKMLPTICDSAMLYGYTDPIDFCGINAPISGILVDQQAALIGQTCTTPGTVKTTYGTGCFMLMNTGETPVYSPNGILTTVAWQIKGVRSYALDGGIYISGAATQWLRDGLKIINTAAETELLALAAESNGGLYFVPSFTGLAAPYWDSYARGMMIGITGGTKKAHIVRATLESTAYQVRDVLDVMRRDSGVEVSVMRCNGRATENRFLMQFQADILGIPLEIPENEETTALGAAFLSSIGVGDYGSVEDLAGIWRCARYYEPKIGADQRMSLLYHWHRAVERAKYWSED